MINKVKKFIGLCKAFNMAFAIKILFYKGNVRNIYVKKIREKYGFLFKKVIDEIEKYKILSSSETNKNIFIFWRQGYNNMPELVKLCYKRLKELYKDYNIHLISQENIDEYISIDENILIRLKQKRITLANFADYIRFKLVYEYGGFWVDSTVFFTKRVELFEFLNKYSFYSLNFPAAQQFICFENYCCKWTAWFFGARKNSPICYAVFRFFEEYYGANKYQLGYFMIDFCLFNFMMMGIDNGALDNIPFSDINPYYICQSAQNNFPIKKEDVFEIQKLSIHTNQKLIFEKIAENNL